MDDELPLRATLAAVTRAGRSGAYGEAAAQLGRAIGQLQGAIAAGALAPAGLAPMAEALRTIAALQAWGDWVAIADVVEHELAPLVAEHVGA